MARARPLAEVYRRFGEIDAAGTLYERVAVALGGSDEVMRALGAAPARTRRPALVLAALHDLALAGQAPDLAAAHATGDGDAAARAAVDTVLRCTGPVLALTARRRLRLRPDETGHAAVLYPAIAEAAHRLGAAAVGLVGLGCSAGLDLVVDRVGIGYGDGRTLGDPSSPVRTTCSIVGGRAVPARAVPGVVARIGVDRDPLDVTDPDDVRWLRACLPPDRPERAARLDAELALAAQTPPLLLRGDPVDLLPAAVDRVPADALPVVLSTWALSRLPVPRRALLLRHLEEAAAGRAVAWVSAEGVGVAPGVPTLGDRPASGHSIIGLVVADRSAPRGEALGRCWSRGRLLSWLA